MIENPGFAAYNIAIAAMIALVIGVAAAAIRPVVARPDQPLGTASALALSAGGFALILFIFAGAGWIGVGKEWRSPLRWWQIPAILHVLIAAAFAFASGRRQPISAAPPPAAPSRWWRLLPALVCLALVIAFALLKCFEPEFDADAIEYHLTLPNYWVMQHGLRAHPTLPRAGYPLLIELIFAIPVSHALPFAAKLAHVGFGVAVVLAIYGFARARLSAAGALSVAAVFFLSDEVNGVAAWAHTDLARTFFLVAAAACLATYARNGERRDLLVGAAIAGLAMSTHYMAIVFGNGLLTIALIVTMWTGRVGGRQIARDLAIFWLVSLAVFAPWIVKNVIHYGHPLYGLPGTNLRIPPLDVVTSFILGNVFLVGFAIAALWILARSRMESDEWLLAVYLLGYLLVGPFEMPPNTRFFFPVYAIGLMLAGRLAAPIFDRHRRLEVAFPAVLLLIAIALIGYQWRQHLFDAPIAFLFYNRPPYYSIVWHQ